MITSLITLLILGLLIYLIWWFTGKFIQGVPLQIIGAILGLIWLLYALRTLGVLNI